MPLTAGMEEECQMSDVSTPQLAALKDLLGLICYGQLAAFGRLATQSADAPDLARRALMSQLAAAELAPYRRLAERLAELGIAPEDAMAPFVAPLDAYHDSTRPADWLEALVKAYIGDGIADDFYREIANLLDDPDRSLILEVLHERALAEFAVEHVREAIAAEDGRGDQLALWARRLVGEAVTQTQRVAAMNPALAGLIASAESDPNGRGELIKRLVAAHAARMRSLGLSN